ncbi:MAG: FAD-dependent thymidylate synthase [Aeromicrobium sp.]
MAYAADILADSTSPAGDRLTTFEITFPRFVLSEFNTHCAISRNSASSRAVPVHKKLHEVLHDPFIPARFGRNQRGMSAAEHLAGAEHDEAVTVWLGARDAAVVAVLQLLAGKDAVSELPDSISERDELLDEVRAASAAPGRLDVHKQIANRLLEPFLWHTVIATATDWNNFFALRTAEGAQPEIQTIARLMLDLRQAATPADVEEGGWHLPLIQPDERPEAEKEPIVWARVSAARCARVSYLTHHGLRDVSADIELGQRLLGDGHMSPFEHVAQCMTARERLQNRRVGKLTGWVPYRSTLPFEDDFSLVLAQRNS